MTTNDFPAEALLAPDLIPSQPQIERIFWDCLSEAELTFGPRAAKWDYQIVLGHLPYPMTSNDGQAHVTVWLTGNRSWVGYYYEAAHEAVHCLNPIPTMVDATYLEEAVASEFSLEIVRRNFGSYGINRCVSGPDYIQARNLVSEIDESIIRFGKRLRERAGALEYVTPEIIKELYPQAQQSAVESALKKFPRQ